MTHGASHARSAGQPGGDYRRHANLSRVLAKVSESGRSQTEGFREFTRDIRRNRPIHAKPVGETEIIAGATRRLDNDGGFGRHRAHAGGGALSALFHY